MPRAAALSDIPGFAPSSGDAWIDLEQFDRVRHHSPDSANRKIAARTRAELARVGHSPEAIRNRLRELGRRWDVDLVLVLNFTALVFAQLPRFEIQAEREALLERLERHRP